jgi:thiamine-phosphate pyrophosphorylase
MDPISTAQAAIAGGADVIQLREKALSDRPLLDLARRLRALTLETETLLIVNDRPDVAALANADGVHVGQDDLPVDQARRIIGGDKLVGLSTHSPEQARAATVAGADYIGVGPMFASQTKSVRDVPGLALLRQVARKVEIPTVAIGGITADNVAEVVAAGGRCVAVCQAVIAAADPQTAARAILQQLEEPPALLGENQ